MEVIAEEVWGVPGAAHLPGGVVFPLRMTVIRLPDGGLWLHSPVALDDTTARAIEALGPVRHLVAPSLLHDLHAGAAKARWPAARLHAPTALRARRPDLPIDEDLSDGSPWGDAIVAVAIRGAPKLDEFEFLHRPSRTLLVTDLAFHVLTPATFATKLVLCGVGCHGRLGSSRAWRWVFAEDRAAVAASVERLLALDFDRLVPAHGDVIASGAAPALRQALSQPLSWRR
jgi:hypothetical protein